MSDFEICVNWLSAWERRRLIWNLRNSALQDFWENNQNKFSKNSFVPPGISSPEKVSVLTDWFAEHSEHKDLRWCNFLQTCLSFFELDSELCFLTVNCVLAFFSLTSHQPLQRPLAPSAASQDHTFHFQRKQTRLIYTAAATSLCVVRILICWRINGWRAKKRRGMIIRLNVGVWLPLGVLPKKSWQRPASH